MTNMLVISIVLCIAVGIYIFMIRKPKLDPTVDEHQGAHASREKDDSHGYARWEAVLQDALDHIYSGTAVSMKQQMLHVFGDPPAAAAAYLAAQVRNFEKVGTLHSSLAALDSPGTSMKELGDLVTRDPVLSARVLKTVNSPFFSTATNVKSIHTAVNILGLTNLKNLVAFDAMPYSLFATPEHQRMFRAIWHHMNATAITASTLAKATQEMDSGTLYTAGLMHDIGKLLLVLFIQKDEYPQSLDQELEWLTVTHVQAARILAAAGDIPAELQTLILDHHLPALLPVQELNRDARHARNLTMLFLANQVAKLISPDGVMLEDVERLAKLEPSYREIVSREEAGRILLSPGLFEDILANVRVVQAMLH